MKEKEKEKNHNRAFEVEFSFCAKNLSVWKCRGQSNVSQPCLHNRMARRDF